VSVRLHIIKRDGGRRQIPSATPAPPTSFRRRGVADNGTQDAMQVATSVEVLGVINAKVDGPLLASARSLAFGRDQVLSFPERRNPCCCCALWARPLHLQLWKANRLSAQVLCKLRTTDRGPFIELFHRRQTAFRIRWRHPAGWPLS